MLSTSKIRSRSFVTEFPIFYGWVVLAAATLSLAVAIIGYSSSISLFLDDLIAEYGVSRTVMSGIMGLGGFLAAFTLPLVGKLVDRYGGRAAALVAMVLYALSMIALTLAVGPLAFFLLYLGLSVTGARPLQVIHSTMIAQWFRSHRGRVMGIAIIAPWLAMSVFIPWFENMLQYHDWRVSVAHPGAWDGAGLRAAGLAASAQSPGTLRSATGWWAAGQCGGSTG